MTVLGLRRRKKLDRPKPARHAWVVTWNAVLVLIVGSFLAFILLRDDEPAGATVLIATFGAVAVLLAHAWTVTRDVEGSNVARLRDDLSDKRLTLIERGLEAMQVLLEAQLEAQHNTNRLLAALVERGGVGDDPSTPAP